MSISYRYEISGILRWAENIDYVQLLGWVRVLYQLTRSRDYIILISFFLGYKLQQAFRWVIHIFVIEKASKILIRDGWKKLDESMSKKSLNLLGTAEGKPKNLIW